MTKPNKTDPTIIDGVYSGNAHAFHVAKVSVLSFCGFMLMIAVGAPRFKIIALVLAAVVGSPLLFYWLGDRAYRRARARKLTASAVLRPAKDD